MKISVYITSYNQKTYLKQAIDSVLVQTRPADEIIIVDDCSTDGSQELIRRYERDYPGLIVPVLHAANTGVSQVRVDALSRCTGDVITYLDGDDRFLPTKLAMESAVLEARADVDVVYSDFTYIDEQGASTQRWAAYEDPPQGDVFVPVFARRFPRGDLFRMEMVRATAWRDAGFHDTSIPIYEDYDMRIRLMHGRKAAFLNEVLSEYRRHGGGLSQADAMRHFVVLRSIYLKNRHLLLSRSKQERSYVKRCLFARMSLPARDAAHAVLTEASMPFLGRRWTAFRLLRFVSRCAPDLFTLGDIYRLLLPSKWAVRLIDGPERAEQRSLADRGSRRVGDPGRDSREAQRAQRQREPRRAQSTRRREEQRGA